MCQRFILTLVALVGVGVSANAQISIREVCPSNIDLILDEDGSSPDWIELWNPGTSPVNLNGWHLSDDADEVLKWSLPQQVLAPDERMLIWVSGKGTSTPVTPRYHPLVTQGSIGAYFVGPPEPPALSLSPPQFLKFLSQGVGFLQKSLN